MTSRYDPDCLSCQAIQGQISLTNTPRILETPLWIVEHAYPTSIRGWLVLVLNRHCRALHDLTAEEFTELGRLLPLLCHALHDVLGTEKEYVIQLAEGEGFHHVHFHVVARLPDWPESLRGQRVFNGIGKKVENPLSSEETAPIAEAVSRYLRERLGG